MVDIEKENLSHIVFVVILGKNYDQCRKSLKN